MATVTAWPASDMRALLTLLFALNVVAACGPNVGQLAKETCAELEGAIVLQAGPILSRAIAEAEGMGASAPELGAAMREECPGLMDAVDNIGDEQRDRDALPGKMSLDVTGCSDSGASGTVTNNSDVTVDLFIEAQFLDAAGTVIDDGIDSVSGVRPGETAKWDASYLGSGDVAQCRGNVSSAFEQ